jgi:hypothetical protein
MKEISECEYADLLQGTATRDVIIKNLNEDIKSKKFFFVALMVISVFALVAATILGEQRDYWKEAHLNLKKELITLGYAHYNPTNGIWEIVKPFQAVDKK